VVKQKFAGGARPFGEDRNKASEPVSSLKMRILYKIRI